MRAEPNLFTKEKGASRGQKHVCTRLPKAPGKCEGCQCLRKGMMHFLVLGHKEAA